MARYAPADLTPMLTEYTLEDAAEALTRLDQRYDLVPSTHRRQFTATVEDLLAAARTHSFTDLHEVIDHWRWLVALAARMPEEALTKPDSLEEADRAHLYRNTLLTLVVAALAGHPGTPKDVGAKMAALGQRTASSLRAHIDDEILLLRMWALHMSLCGDKNSRRTAAVYGEIDAGLNAGETAEIKPEHVIFENDLVVDGDTASGVIQAPGLHGVSNRDIDLGPYNCHLILNHINGADLRNRKLLTYWPRKEYTKEAVRYAKGCSSVITAINGIREQAGLHHKDTAASSITEWRIRHTRDTQGHDAALKLSGRHTTCLNGRLKDRNPSPEPDETHTAKSQKNRMLDI